MDMNNFKKKQAEMLMDYGQSLMKKEGVSGLSSRKDLAEKRLLELMSDLEKKRMKLKEKENEKIIKKYMGGSLRKGKK